MSAVALGDDDDEIKPKGLKKFSRPYSYLFKVGVCMFACWNLSKSGIL